MRIGIALFMGSLLCIGTVGCDLSEDAGGNESILGVSSCGIRANPDPCP